MKNKFLSLVFAVIILTASVFAGTPQTQQGAKSLYFGFTGLSELSVDNTTLGATYLFGDNIGLWGEVGFNFAKDKPVKTGEEYATNNISIGAGMIYYAFQKGPVAIFVTPSIGFASSKVESAGTIEKIKTSTTTSIYGGVGVGAQWWIFDNVSLHIFTMLGYQGDTVKQEEGNTNTESTSSIIGVIGSQNSKLAISFFF